MMNGIEAAAQRSPRMLIADDDPAIVRSLADRCVAMGFQVETAANGIQLLVKARQSQPDILIVDVNMPELDGISVCLRLLDLSSKPIEVIVVTGSLAPEMAQQCEGLGMYCALKGPDFWNSIESALVEIYPDMADRIAGLKMPPPGNEVHRRPRVLVVDDDPAIQQFLASRLGKLGIEMLYASDAEHAFRIAYNACPSVIITDNFMPNGSAHYLLSKLRSTPATEYIPVFVISGRQLDDHTEKTLKREICGRPGAAQIFKKSFDTTELFGALQKFCSFEKHYASV